MSQTAVSVRRYSRFFKKSGATKVLDYGTGTMRNALYLAEQGFKVYAADLPEQVAALVPCPAVQRLAGLLDTKQLCMSRLNVDLVISTYVFNIILKFEEQHQYVANAVRNLRPGGYLLIEVQCRREGSVCGVDCSHFFKCPTCAKTYTHTELDLLLQPFGLHRISHYYRRRALAAIYQQKE
jgi:SAM-dependent methyltransferase